MAKRTMSDIAQNLINSANEDDETMPERAAATRQEALVYAVLAVADELAQLREAIDGVEGALTDQDNFGAGIHLHYISDWLKKLAEK